MGLLILKQSSNVFDLKTKFWRVQEEQTEFGRELETNQNTKYWNEN